MLGIKRNLFSSEPLNRSEENRSKVRKLEYDRNKKPLLAPEYNLQCEKIGTFIAINGDKFMIEELGSGNFHKVYSFNENQTLTLNNTIIDLAKTVLKVVNPQVGPNKFISTIKDGCEAYARLLQDNVPLPKVYIHPTEFKDTDSRSGNFWIIERLPKQATPKDPEAMEFVKEWATRSMKENKLFILDFKPRNVMMDEDNNCYVVDFDNTSHLDEFSLEEEIFEILHEWSENNRDIFIDLCSDMDETSKIKLIDLFDKK